MKKALLFSVCIVIVISFSNLYTLALPEENNVIWAIFKISYDPINNRPAEGGICGTAFFVKDRIFVSANHCFNKKSFEPNAGYPKVKTFLVNENGCIIDNLKIRKLIPEYDLAIGEIDHPCKDIAPYIVEHEFNVGDIVYNIGFPTSKSLINHEFKIKDDQLIVENIHLRSFEQEGNVTNILPRTIRGNDVNLENKIVIELDHTSEEGFSGGPLLQKTSNKVIGMMSFLVPKTQDPHAPVAAIRMCDIMQFLD